MRNGAPLDPDLLGTLQAGLAEVTQPAGLHLIETVTIDEVGWLEYRRVQADGPLVLTVTYRADDKTLAAELWRPSRLAAAQATGDFDQAIDAARTWVCEREALSDGVGGDVRRTVADWLQHSPV